MDINAARVETAEALGVPETDFSYITEELLRDFQTNAKPADTSSGSADGLVGVAGNWGTYGNSITFFG